LGGGSENDRKEAQGGKGGAVTKSDVGGFSIKEEGNYIASTKKEKPRKGVA